VILWTSYQVASIGQQKIEWAGLHKAISITLCNGKPYEAVWVFQPLGTGTAILLAAVITAIAVRLPVRPSSAASAKRPARSGSPLLR
jgi:lactate permease